MTRKSKVLSPVINTVWRVIMEGTPPSVNLLYGYRAIKGHAMKYKTKRGKDYIKSLREKFKKVYPTHEPFSNNCSMIIRVYFGDKRKHDVDNVCKAILDSFNGLVYEDDNQIQKLTLEKFYDKGKARTEIIIER